MSFDELHLGSRWLLCLESDGLEATRRWLPRGGCHDRVRTPNDLGGGAVIAYQADHRRFRKTSTKPSEVAGLGASEGVDGLRRITDDAQLRSVAAPQIEQRLLERADILILIDNQMPVGPSNHVGDLWML